MLLLLLLLRVMNARAAAAASFATTISSFVSSFSFVSSSVRCLVCTNDAKSIIHGPFYHASTRTTIATIATTTTTTTTTTPTRLFGSSSSSDEQQQQQQQQQRVNGGLGDGFAQNNHNNTTTTTTNRRPKIPQTGWNHNLPSESSDFWINRNNNNDDDNNNNNNDEKSSTTSGPTSRQTTLQLRTGWLHNTRPAAQPQQPQQKQQPPVSPSPLSPSPANTIPNPARQRRLEQTMRHQQRNHRLQGIHFVPVGDVRMAVTEHVLSVPLVRRTATTGNDDDDEKQATTTTTPRVDIFFTVVEKVTDESRRWLEHENLTNPSSSISPEQRATAYVQGAQQTTADHMVLYLQGGPGFGAPTPMVQLGWNSPTTSWAAQALLSGSSYPYTRVVLMDQRGTGRSSPVTKQYLQQAFPDLFLLDDIAGTTVTTGCEQNAISLNLSDWATTHPEQVQRVHQAVAQVTDFLSHFRADNIVLDAEEVREALLLPPGATDQDTVVAAAAATSSETRPDSATPSLSVVPDHPGPRPWGCVLGQSFGGFCVMSYLSLVPDPPRVNLLTGGIAPMLTPLDKVYTSLWERVRERNYRYYEMFPDDVALVKTIVRKLLQQPEPLPSGGRLTARRFLQLGLSLGSSPSAFPSLHALLHSSLLHGRNDERTPFTRAFLKQVELDQSFDDHPFYYWLHESIYADGDFNGATQWSAHRVYNQMVKEQSSDFDYTVTSCESDDRPVLFFGEMVFPWMAEDYAELNGLGLTSVAHAVANKSDWPRLFDANQMRAALGSGKCQVAACIYHEDMYVDFDACMQVTKRGGPLEKCKVYVTNEFQHSGLRDDGATIFSKLYRMATGRLRTPS